MHVQLAAVDTAEATRRRPAHHLPRALERVGSAPALVQRHARGVDLSVGDVEVARGEAQASPVDGVEKGEDEEVQFGGEGGDGRCAAAGGAVGGRCRGGAGCSCLGGGGGRHNSREAGDESMREWRVRRIDTSGVQRGLGEDLSCSHDG